MKKIFSLLLLTALLSGCASSGRNQTPTGGTLPTEPPYVTLPANGTEAPAVTEAGATADCVSLDIQSIDDVIRVQWQNNTDQTLIHSYAYDIEILRDNSWVSCADGTASWIDLAQEIAPGQTEDMTCDLQGFDLSQPGTYRLTVEYSIPSLVGFESCPLSVEFTIAEKKPVGSLTDPLPGNTGCCQFSAQYIRTDGYLPSANYPVVTVIRSNAELNAYYERNKTLYNLERSGSDSVTSFLDACDRYDAAYFEDRVLILILVECGSGSTRFRVTDVGFQGSEFIVDVESYIPGDAGTCDMAQWHIFVEAEAGISVPDQVTVLLNGQKPTQSGSHHIQ